MITLSELQSRKVGLIELLSMGFNVYLKNFKPILLLFCTTNLPFLIILSALIAHNQNNPSVLSWAFYLVFVIVASMAMSIYEIATSVIPHFSQKGRSLNSKSLLYLGLTLVFIAEVKGQCVLRVPV